MGSENAVLFSLTIGESLVSVIGKATYIFGTASSTWCASITQRTLLVLRLASHLLRLRVQALYHAFDRLSRLLVVDREKLAVVFENYVEHAVLVELDRLHLREAVN